LAHIDTLTTAEVSGQAFEDFQIIQTESDGEVTVRIPPDVSICAACEAELFDPTNRRYRYPFITCTHCGVRYSIIEHLPYDRPNTSMRFFPMCDACVAEYRNPRDRRYHAQPIGCWECGPQLSLWDNSAQIPLPQTGIISRAATMLKEGKILAVKGVGGYHLMCDATNAESIGRLRKRKRRPDKPFAVMVKDIAMAQELAEINEQEETLLTSMERPVVIVGERTPRPTGIAPGLSHIGLFLPYAPLHLLLLDELDRPVVATSANISDEPICTDRESLSGLGHVYDAILDHDRPIINGIDDSVAMVVRDRTILLRRARGFAPVSVALPFALADKILALGANQKSTIAIGFDDQAILSPHIGDLGTIGSVEYYKKNIDTLQRLYNFTPERIVHDLHPTYESTKVANQLSAHYALPTTHSTQHHHAHILGVMAEKGIKGKVFGVAFDGTGYGEDGALWGGEFLVCDYEKYERVGHLKYFRLLGGEQAIREPRRVALSLLFDAYGEAAIDLDNPTTQAFTTQERKTAYLMWQKGLNAPLSSSAGRFFDAVASLRGVCQQMNFEGQSGMLLEELYDPTITGHYSFDLEDGQIDLRPLIKAILYEADTPTAVTRFFHTLVEMAASAYAPYAHLPLVLSGGVFQNRILIGLMLDRFPEAILPELIPPNDGGIALGQIAAFKGMYR
jgi:hydrogenase maturation protein HypF